MGFWGIIGKGLYYIVIGILILVVLVLFVWLAGWIFSHAWNNTFTVVFDWKTIDTNTGIWFLILAMFLKPSINYTKKSN